eukprot:scaffold2844_cov326-Pavlova_lutheri.AAC.17
MVFVETWPLNRFSSDDAGRHDFLTITSARDGGSRQWKNVVYESSVRRLCPHAREDAEPWISKQRM